MPTAGTHITIVQRLARDPALQPLLGDPAADEDTPAGRRMRFANLGAVGPDIFYLMADYGADLQDFENFMVKVGGSFQCLGDLMEQVGTYVSGVESNITFGISDSLKASTDLLIGILKEGLLGLTVVEGVNFLAFFEAARQKDQPRTKWFWADYLHYIRTGKFARKLLDKSQGNPNLRAYALGYLTHYVTDVVGHPYVNQVVEAPWRLYWQRHHLVENFVDAYVWDRWHTSNPPPTPPSTEEQPLDTVTSVPNAMGTGAPFTFSRLHDLISIGVPGTLGDPVDAVVTAVCDKINQGLFELGIAEPTVPTLPEDADFQAWTVMMAEALREVYLDDPHPQNLAGGLTPLGTPRPDGFPTPEDIGSAYGMMRLFLKFTTESHIPEPTPPAVGGGVSAAIQQLLDDMTQDLNNLAQALGSPLPPPLPSSHLSFSWQHLWAALKSAAAWLADVAAAVATTVFDFVKDLIIAAGTAVSEPIKFALYLLNKALFAMYRTVRDVLVVMAYAAPYTSELDSQLGPLKMSSLWRSMGDAPPGRYPIEEIPAERVMIGTDYAPFVPPGMFGATVEQPPIELTAPYAPTTTVINGHVHKVATLPDDFIEAPLGPDCMFLETGPLQPATTGGPQPLGTFAGQRNFGGAMANCRRAVELAQKSFPGGTLLPDYNLDGDRGYAWPCWDVVPPPASPESAGDPLRPDHPANAGTAQVNATKVTG
jgi:hypothetical protein